MPAITEKEKSRVRAAARPHPLSNSSASLEHDLLRRALSEDLAKGDVTSIAVIPPRLSVEAAIIYKEPAIVAGIDVVKAVFQMIDADIALEVLEADGSRIESQAKEAVLLRGSARSLLAGERTALNFLQRLSAIATTTDKFVKKAAPYGIAIVDTRKTTPALRSFERYAVSIGGGQNHRYSLSDGVLIKDNHIRLAGGVGEALRRARLNCPGMPIEVETTTLDEVMEAIKGKPNVIMLDNMPGRDVARAVELIAGRCYIEVSGGVTLENLSEYLINGVDAISVGALTHSQRSIDISLEVK